MNPISRIGCASLYLLLGLAMVLVPLCGLRAQEPARPPGYLSIGGGALHLQAVEGALYSRRTTGPGLHLDLLSEKRKDQLREWRLQLQYGRPRTGREDESASHWVRVRFGYVRLWPVWWLGRPNEPVSESYKQSAGRPFIFVRALFAGEVFCPGPSGGENIPQADRQTINHYRHASTSS